MGHWKWGRVYYWINRKWVPRISWISKSEGGRGLSLHPVLVWARPMVLWEESQGKQVWIVFSIPLRRWIGVIKTWSKRFRFGRTLFSVTRIFWLHEHKQRPLNFPSIMEKRDWNHRNCETLWKSLSLAPLKYRGSMNSYIPFSLPVLKKCLLFFFT
jgi:hypothetical protein